MGIPTAISDGSLYIDVDTDTAGLAYNQEKNEHVDTEEAELSRFQKKTEGN